MVARNRRSPAYQEALRQARLHGPATRRGTRRPGGDDKSAADRARGPAYVRRQYQQQFGRDAAAELRKQAPNTTVPPDLSWIAAYMRRAKKADERRAERLAPALTVLENVSRPVHALAAAAREDIRDIKAGRLPVGQGSLKAAGRGLRLKDKSLFSDVLRDVGVKGAAASVGGFALDVLADPTTYVSLGTASVARKTAEQAARKATAQALKQGASKQAANRAGRAAAQRALKTAPKGKGLTVGFGPVRTSGKTTAKVDQRLGLDRAAERVRGALPGRMVRHVNPRVRPAGVSEPEWQRVRAAMRRGRAKAAVGERRARNIAQAVARALPGDNHARVIDALEGRSLKGLTDTEQKVVRALAREFDDMYRAEHSRGLVGRKFREFGYFPRKLRSDLDPQHVGWRRSSGAQLESSKARTNRRMYSEFRGTDDDIYTQNAAVALYLRARDSAVKLGRKEVIDELHTIGRRWHPGVALKDGEDIYRFAADGRKMPARVEGAELKSLIRGGAPPGQNEYRVLKRELVRTAERSMPERVEDLEELGRIWDRQVQGRVKTVLTVINPQYHATNMYGDLWKAYTEAPVVQLARNLGVSARALAYRAKREAAAKTLGKVLDPASKGVRIDGRRVGFDELVKEAEEHGAINMGFIGRDLADVLDAQGKEAAERLGQGRIARRSKVTQRVAASRAGSRVLHPIDAIRDVSQYREDWVRLAVYLGARKAGKTADEAADHSNRVLIDYGELSQFERSVLRRVLPFYTFTARNAPQQVRALVQRPGKFANLEKLRQEGEKASGLPEGYEDQLRDFEQKGIPMPVPKGVRLPGMDDLLYPKLPAMDLNRLTVTDQGNFLMAMLTPVLKVPIEWDQNYNFFFREKIDQLLDERGPNGERARTLKPAPKWLIENVSRLPFGKDLVEALHIRRFTDKRTGKRVWGWPAKLDYLLKSTPLSGTALQFGTGAPNSRGQSQGQRLLGYASGLKFAPFEQAEIDRRNLGSEYGYLQARAKAMRDQGDAYDRNGQRTRAYQQVLDRTREVAGKLGVYDKRRKPSLLSPEAQAALESLKGSGGPQLSPGAKAALESLRP